MPPTESPPTSRRPPPSLRRGLSRVRLGSWLTLGAVAGILLAHGTWLIPALHTVRGDVAVAHSALRQQLRAQEIVFYSANPPEDRGQLSAAITAFDTEQVAFLELLERHRFLEDERIAAQVGRLEVPHERLLAVVRAIPTTPDPLVVRRSAERFLEEIEVLVTEVARRATTQVDVIGSVGWWFLLFISSFLVLVSFGGMLPAVRLLREQVSTVETSREEAFEAREESDRRRREIEDLLDASLDPIFVTDVEGAIISVSASVAQVFGHDRDTLIGAPIETIMPEPHRSAHASYMARALRPSDGDDTFFELVHEVEGLHRDGHTVPLQLKITRVETPEGLRYVGITRDITRENDRERRLKDRNDELREARRAAESATRVQTEFITNMSHEIRTPMTAIIGHADALHDELGATHPELASVARRIVESGESLAAMIEDLLELSRLEDGNVELHHERFALRPFLESITEAPAQRARARGIDFSLEISSQLPDRIETDRSRLRLVLSHLISNAVKFTDQGSIRVKVERAKIESAPVLSFRVIDTGVGIDPELAREIFEAFSQADGTLTRRHGGVGLGLTLAARLAALIGGRVELVESTLEEGSEFRAVLPIALSLFRSEDPDEDRDRSSPGPDRGPEARPLSGRTILVVEDNPESSALFARALERAGAVVETAEHGGVALSKVATRAPEEYDLVVMDIQMPEVDGLAATRRMRAQGYGSPITALTAHSAAGERARCLSAGCDEFLTKPISPRQLVEAARQIIEDISLQA